MTKYIGSTEFADVRDPEEDSFEAIRAAAYIFENTGLVRDFIELYTGQWVCIDIDGNNVGPLYYGLEACIDGQIESLGFEDE